MSSTELPLIGLVVGIAATLLLIVAFILWRLLKLFKTPNPRYGTSLLTLGLYAISVAGTGFLLYYLNVDLPSAIMITIAVAVIAWLALLILITHARWWQIIVAGIIVTLVTPIVYILLILPVRTWIVEPFFVRGPLMVPSFTDGDYVIANRLTKNIVQGDVVIAHAEDVLRVLRILAIPGDTVEINEGRVIVNNQLLAEPYATNSLQGSLNPGTLPPQAYLLAFDNRTALESGPGWYIVTESDILGPIIFRWPLNF